MQSAGCCCVPPQVRFRPPRPPGRRTHLCQTLCTFVLIASTLSSGIAVRISTMRGMSFWRMRTVKEAMSKMLSNGTYSEEQGRNGLV